MPKKKKSVMEEELQSFSQGKTCTPDNAPKRIIDIINKHAKNIREKKNRYLYCDVSDCDLYRTYADIEIAFDLLIEDLQKEGFEV